MLCLHTNKWFPRTREDGSISSYCPDCGEYVPCKVEFGDFRPERMRTDVERQEREGKTAKAGA